MKVNVILLSGIERHVFVKCSLLFCKTKQKQKKPHKATQKIIPSVVCAKSMKLQPVLCKKQGTGHMRNMHAVS